MKRVECTQCDKAFTKRNSALAEAALSMHVGRVHSKTISNNGGVHRHNGHATEEDMPKAKNASRLSIDERKAVLTYIRENHGNFSTKTACFHEAMKAAGATGKLKESSTAVGNHFKRALAASTAVIEKPKHRQFYRGDVVEKVLSHYATPVLDKCDCPVCHYDFRLLKTSKVPARYCPGCGTPLQNLINQLLTLLAP